MVIGGIAVGAYGRLNRETILSADLDVYTTIDTQIQVLDWAPRNGIKVAKRPQPRALPVAFLQWQGKEINVLTETKGLPPPAEAFQEPEGLALRLLPHARLPSDFRFLLGRAPTGEFAEAVLRALPESLGLCEELERIRDRRQT
jgi:hypothetical protein